MKHIKIIFCVITFSIYFSCSQDNKHNIEIKGNTMGTYYQISLIDVPKTITKDKLELDIRNTLSKANNILSNWDKSSEISKLNNNKTIKPIKISNELLEVIDEANYINVKSNGYFDVTLDPLIELWGFGYTKNNIIKKVPEKNQISDTLALVNQRAFVKINIPKNELMKKNKHIKLNLSAIGKGYGIDLIGKKLEDLNITNYIIDIGGDIFARGQNKKKQKWVIGIENPKLDEKLIKEIVNVSNKGVATSGEYKNYFSKDGKKYSHIINPKTGLPITHSTKSVTVIAKNAMSADGWATALIAMGSEMGLKIAEKEKIAVLFIDKINGKFVKIKSTEFNNLK